MEFEKTKIDGAVLIKRIPYEDERGSFARFFCAEEFGGVGINTSYVQMNFCTNTNANTLRGLHYQIGRAAEDKLVVCVEGCVWDVCVDLRKDSPTYCQYVGYELSKTNGKMLFIPKGCAHGYLTLTANSNLVYLMSEFYIENMSAGYRYDDPTFAIDWPIMNNLVISKKDATLPFIEK